MRIYSALSLRSLLISRVVMGFGGGAFLVRAVILVRLKGRGQSTVSLTTLSQPRGSLY